MNIKMIGSKKNLYLSGFITGILILTIMFMGTLTAAFAEDSSSSAASTDAAIKTVISEVSVTPNPFSPDGDKLNDVGSIKFKISQKANVKITIQNYKGEVKLIWNNFTKPEGSYSAGWTGTSNKGKVLPNGNYQFKIVAGNSAGDTVYTGNIALKNPSPIFTNVVIGPNPFSPNGDGVTDTTGFGYSLNTNANVTIDIYNWLGKIKTVTANLKRGPGAHTEGWTGTDLLGHPLANGTYKVVMTAVNSFGSTSISKTVTVEGVVGGGPRWIYIDRSERALYLKDGNFLLKRYPIAVGRPGFETPINTYTVVRKDINPTWYPPDWADEEYPVAYPQSPLGPRRLLLSDRSYGIHGTLSRSAIGKAVTHGCIRLYNEDIKQLYDLVPVGTIVKIVP